MSSALTEVSLSDVRCFSGEQRARLSKMTLLVGENSVGKSTFLGCLNALGRLAGLRDLEDHINWFDKRPFSMGSFDSVARSGSTSFRVAIGLTGGPFSQFAIRFERGAGVVPKETVLELQLSDGSAETEPTLTVVREGSGGQPERWRFDGPAFRFRLDQSEVSDGQFTTWLSKAIRRGQLPFAGERTQFEKRAGATAKQDLTAFVRFVNFFRQRFRAPETPLAIKPIHPRGLDRQRLYPFNPLAGPSDPLDLDAINEAGRQLGLFNRIDVRRRSPGEYEVLADVSGSLRNLMDVGFGVSSLLPFLKALVSAPANSLFLLQQPEVHIHPSAQARLVEVMARSDHAFVIETHSDHVIRWLRILVKEQQLSPSDVSIIYFESFADDQSATRLHQISLDSRANLSGQPRTYRQFFSLETAKLLGFPT